MAENFFRKFSLVAFILLIGKFYLFGCKTAPRSKGTGSLLILLNWLPENVFSNEFIYTFKGFFSEFSFRYFYFLVMAFLIDSFKVLFLYKLEILSV